MTSAAVVGSGPNGLAAAVRLAQAGLDVTVLEAADVVGGGTRTSELTVPGLLHDECSAFHPMGVASPFLSSLGLERYGLRWLWPEVDLAHPLDDGRAGVVSRDMARTVASLGVDGDRWRRLFAPLEDGFDDLLAAPYVNAFNYLAPLLAAEHEQGALELEVTGHGQHRLYPGGELGIRGLLVEERDANGRPSAVVHQDPGAVLRFATLDAQSYWLDELVTVSLLDRGFGDMLDGIRETEATPYLYYVLAWPWTHAFGLGEVGLRSLSALAGTIAVPVSYAAAAALCSRRVGLVVAALVAVHPFLVWYAQEARAYLCEKVNELPGKLGTIIALAERRRELVGPTTTIAPPPDLTPEEAVELARLQDEIARLTEDLGRPIDCRLAATGTTLAGRP